MKKQEIEKIIRTYIPAKTLLGSNREKFIYEIQELITKNQPDMVKVSQDGLTEMVEPNETRRKVSRAFYDQEMKQYKEAKSIPRLQLELNQAKEKNNKQACRNHDLTVELEQANQENEKLKEAMQLFVDRCEKGEVRSTKTYNQFKQLLSNTKQD